MKSARPKFILRRIFLRTEVQRETALAVITNAPLDDIRPLEFVLCEEVKTRNLDQNSAMWSGPLFDISEQAWIDKRRLTAKGWHEVFKRLYLPEEFDAELCKKAYQKWDYDLDGEPILIGSSTDLTVKGFAQYLTQVEAHGANMGVMYHANPHESDYQ